MRNGFVQRGAALLLAAAGTAVIAAPAGAHMRTHAPRHRLGAGTSTNWSGYSVDGTNASSVTGSWVVQPSDCLTARETSWSSPWVGIDGDNSSTVEQTGTDSDCNSGAPYYYAWWEMYPKSTVVISQITVNPGDHMTGTVSYAGGQYTLALKDLTSGRSFSTVQSSSKAKRSSVEWIVEGPSNGTLTDFGSLPFSNDSATISGQSASLDAFGSTANEITMVSKQGTVRAQPGTPGSGGAFTDTWLHG